MKRRAFIPHSVSSLALLALIGGCGETGPSIRLDPAAITNVTGVPLSGPAGEVLAERVIVMVLDAAQNPLPGVTVTFSASGAGASVSPSSTVTNDQGEASTRWTLARTPGQQVLTVTAGGTSLQINATAGAPRIASLAVNAGNNQSAPTGAPLPTPPSVIARDASGAPVEGVAISFAVLSGGGSVTPSSVVTNAQGIAAVQWTLGPNSGSQLLSAQVPQSGVTGNPIMFTATATAGAPASVQAISATQQSAGAGALVSSAPSVIVRDAVGNPVANVQVTFAVTSGGGSLTGPTQTTNSLGIATVGSWRLGSTPGTNTVTATVQGVAPATFTATGNAGTPTQMIKTAGDNQSAPLNRAVPIPPQVRVVDAAGNGVAGVLVTFTAQSGDGTAIVTSVTTGSDGRASVGAWILGPTPGPNTLVASASGLASVTFLATGTSGPPATMTAQSSQSQQGFANQPVASVPSVIIRDAQGNPVPNITVNFTVTSGGGTVTGATQVTNNQGIATVGSWILGPIGGQNTLTASAPATSLPNVVFTATTTGTPAALVIVAGNNEAAVAGFETPTPPTVRVIDNVGNGVSGINVNFAITSGGGSVGNTSVTTDATGFATTTWTLGGAANQTMQASIFAVVPGNPAVFSAISATTIVITAQPANIAANTQFSVTVELRSAGGVLAPVDGHTVQITKLTGPGALGGTLTRATVGGVATFSNLTLSSSGTYTLRVTGVGLIPATTTNITVP